MPIVLALIAVLALLVAPATVLGHDLEPSTARPDVVVDIGSSVSPREVRVPAGTIVGWVNRDDDEHRIRSRSGPAEFDSGNLEPGERFAVRLTAPGTYAYVDDRERDDGSYHGRIVVTSASPDDAGTDSGAGSGGGGGSAGGGGSTGGGGTTDGGGAPTAVTASIGDRVFQPSTIRVAAGGTVTWTNDDDDEHTVTATDASFDSGVMGGGATHRQRFPTAGTFAFLCALHPEMRGEVEVVGVGGGAPAPAATPRPAPTPTAVPAEPAAPADGGGVASTATVEMQDFAFGPTSVTITTGGTVTFTNVGAAPHTATAGDGTFDTEMVAAGEKATVTFGHPGTFAFVCTYHPEMRGEIDVVAAAVGGTGASPSPIPTASASPDADASAAPSATTTSEAASGGAGGGGPTSADEGGDAATAATASSTRALDGLVGLIVGVTLVSVAAALFARTINGTVRRPS